MVDTQTQIDGFGDGIPIAPFNWTGYNKSQTHEKHLFMKLLHELVNLPYSDSIHSKGRKPMPSNHVIFCMGMKVYSKLSSRRLISDLKFSRDKGYLAVVPHFNSVLNYFRSRNVTKHLHYLIMLSSLPLIQLETQFAIDSTGISTRQYLDRWSTIRKSYERHREYKKVHCITGTRSNIIPSCIVTDGTKGDSPYFQTLLKNAAENFNIEQITADAAYLSRDNLNTANELNVSPYILFKKNSIPNSRGSPTWTKMYNLFKNNPEKFLKAYHRRSNIESSFMMLKTRCGDFVFSKDNTAQVNEILTKILVHNITILIQEMFMSGIEIDFINCAKTWDAQ